MTRTAAVYLTSVSVLLSLATTPCSGRATHLRGSSTTPESANKRVNFSGNKLRGGGVSGRNLQAKASAGAGLGGASNSSTSDLAATTAPSPAALAAEPPFPECTSLVVPSVTGALSGTYTFRGRYNNGRPVYVDAVTNNDVFSMSVRGEGTGGWDGPANWYITQPNASSNFFLSLESDAFEPTDLDGPHSWTRNNDPSCPSCLYSISISCEVLTANYTTAPTPVPAVAAASPSFTPAPDTATAAATTAENATVTPPPVTATAPPTNATSTFLYSQGGNTTSSAAVASAVTETSSSPSSGITGCVNLDIKKGGDRAGIYAMDTDVDGTVVLHNERPKYSAIGSSARTDEVFSVVMDVCASGYGVVNASWADAVGELNQTASLRKVFLMYVAKNPDLHNAIDTCEVDVWLVTSGGATGLGNAGNDTFFSVSGLEDPSEVASWAQFTPATETARATLKDNFWIDVGCANAEQVMAAEESAAGGGAAGTSAAAATSPPTSTPAPVGTKPSSRRLQAALQHQI